MQHSDGADARILALAGSFRKGPLIQALIRATRELAPARVQSADFGLRTLPFYDGDLVAAGNLEKVTAQIVGVSG